MSECCKHGKPVYDKQFFVKQEQRHNKQTSYLGHETLFYLSLFKYCFATTLRPWCKHVNNIYVKFMSKVPSSKVPSKFFWLNYNTAISENHMEYLLTKCGKYFIILLELVCSLRIFGKDISILGYGYGWCTWPFGCYLTGIILYTSYTIHSEEIYGKINCFSVIYAYVV